MKSHLNTDDGSSALETDLQVLATNRLLEALVESENRMKQRVNLLREVVFELDDSGTIVFLNSAWSRLMGTDVQSAVGLRLSDFIVPEDQHTYGAILSDTVAFDQPSPPVVRMSKPNGLIAWVELSVVGLPKMGHVGTLHDVTEQQNNRQELELLSLVVNATDNFVVITDAFGKIEWVNASFLRKTGYRFGEIKGMSPGRLLQGPGTDQKEIARISTELGNKKPVESKILNYTSTGEEYWTTMHINPIFNKQGNIERFISVQADTTGLHKVQAELAEAIDRELTTGKEIQRVLLLGEVPTGIHGAYIGKLSEPSKGIDGDFFTINKYSDTCFDLLIGDVMGKGIPAALIGAAIKNAYYKVLTHLLALPSGDGCLPQPEAIINALHELMTPRLIALDAFVTLTLYRFDLEAGTLTFCNAGHTPGLVYNPLEDWPRSILGENLPIGVMPNEVYVQSSIPVGPGDVLLAYSDGITEAQNAEHEEYGEQRLCQLLRASKAIKLHPSVVLEALRHDLRKFTGSQQPSDDRTAVLIKLDDRRGPLRRGIAHRRAPELFTLNWGFGALGELRARVHAAAGILTEDERDALTLATFEAATNIIRHAAPSSTDATICCSITNENAAVTVELIYAGEPFTPPPAVGSDFSGNSEGGFGLFIIEQSVDSVEYGSSMQGIASIRLTKACSRHPH